MAIDEVSQQEPLPMNPPEGSSAKFIGLIIVLVGLAIGEVYTLSRMGSLRKALEAQQAKARQELSTEFQAQISDRLSAFERSNAQQLEALKTEIEAATKRMGSAGGELRRARASVNQLENEQKRQVDVLKQELARKADQQQFGALTQNVSATRTDLDSTKKVLEATRAELGMARSEFGTLIARNHDEIEQLRKMGEREYFEFVLDRNHPQRVAGIGLILKKVNLGRHRFSLTLVADDMEIEKKDRTVNEPIFFYTAGSKKPYELVVNKVQSNQVVGYLSTQKGAVQMASRSEGAR